MNFTPLLPITFFTNRLLIIHGLIVLTLFSFASNPVFANTTQHHMNLVLSGSYFDYREYSSTQRELNRESGFIPGLGLEWQNNNRFLTIKASGLFQENQVKYDGAIQSGQSYQTNTDETLRHFSFSISPAVIAPVVPRAGFGHWYWERHILPGSIIATNGTQPVIGLLEEYQWPYFEVGVDLFLDKIFTSSHFHYKQLLTLSWTKPLNAKMEVFLPNHQITVEPTSKTGYYLSYGIQKGALAFSLYHRRWNLGQSPIVSNIFEPASETKITGLNLKLQLF